METVRYTVQGLADDAASTDLINTITPLNGVASIEADTSSRTLTVEYDPHYADPDGITSAIVNSGYPIEGEAPAGG